MAFAMVSFASCSINADFDDDDEQTTSNSNIELTTTKTSSSITLSWKPVQGCFWYRIYTAKKGETLNQIANYQDIIHSTITYDIKDLAANTAYEIKIEGYDYASGGKLLVSKTISVSTNQ